MVNHVSRTLLVAAGLALAAASPAQAQQATGEADIFAPVTNAAPATASAPPAQDPGQQKPAKKIKTAASQKTAAAPAAMLAGSDADQRLQQIEEQLADMQVVVGTLESTGKGRPAGAAPATGNGDTDVRVGRLEAQLQNLNAQMTELANQLRALDARLAAGGGTAPLRTQQPAIPRQSGALQAAPGEQPALADSSFGKTTVAGGPDDQTGGATESVTLEPLANTQALPTLTAAPRLPLPPAQPAPHVAALTPPQSNDPQTAYDLAYGLILQQDYAGAEAAFRDYIGRFPQSPLASNAHYWFGQSFYARGQYKPAADAFLKGYKTYRTGQKAPDSLLKVAMSLSRLGQKDTACSAFTALDGEFPNAPVQVKHLAQTERERTGC